MSTILKMKQRFETLNTDTIINDIMVASTGDLADINREQMYEGKTNQNLDIRPSYLEDPYFKSRAQAQAYSDWKDRITPNRRRTPGTPNLFINGFFYSSITVTVSGDKIMYGSTWNRGRDIGEKFKNIYGLGGEFKSVFVNNYLRPVFKDKILAATGLKMGK